MGGDNLGGDGLTSRRVTLREPADILGVSKEAVRKRVIRGTLPSEKGGDGRVYVYLPEVAGVTDAVTPEEDDSAKHERDTLTSQMQARIDSLERQLEQADERDRENRRLLAAALERIPPQLEAPPESPVSSDSGPTLTDTPEGPQAGTQGPQRPWWVFWR